MFLYGASGHAKVIIDILESLNVEVKGLFDDNIEIRYLSNYEVFGKFNNILLGNDNLIISIGNNVIRKRIADQLSVNYGNAIHRSALISSSSCIGKGTVIMQNAVIQSEAIVGKHCIINTSSIIEHECRIDDFAHISPNATLCGNVVVGEGTHIGAGAIVLPGVRIGNWVTIGAGSVILKNIPDNVTAVGNPGKIIK